MLRTAARSFALVIGATLAIQSAHAEGKLNTIEQFKTGSSELMVATFTDQEKGKTTKVGLLGTASPHRNSFALKLDDWLAMIDLWNKSIVVQSSTWKVTGTMTETDTSDVSQLTVSAGPGVSFMITSPKSGSVTYALDRKDAGR